MVVKIYTTPICVYCKAAKQLFNEHNIQYQEINVIEDRNALNEMVARSGQLGVPVIEIDNNIVVGFNKPKIMELLNLK
ncbi:MAG: NrdH-redoxin [Candidatus Terrybacteria bacterium RIFCSPLOWO2_01_FULL_40_23]|uniref:NrdH-redoxin n=1 Tax=Candidatus Terrybacteria bacterium RIFCSPLOWO2_01_FULL_40_23 TaxID=1802366 RepID=A0A1G2PSK4_9BACT|nr:MAG: NrdH-redoxin [Candidatus Terrybacteria bacterium RIFCSPLOWO2_01_FULL_40_23]